MAVKIRLQRHGARHRPFYRVVVADERARRDGRFVEIVGTYDPRNKKKDEQVKIRLDRTEYWLGVGAQPTDTARTLINRYKRENQDQVQALAEGRPLPVKETVPAAAKKEAVSAAPTGGSSSSEEPAEQEAKDVANESAANSPSGQPEAGANAAEGKTPFEGATDAQGKEPKPAWEGENQPAEDKTSEEKNS